MSAYRVTVQRGDSHWLLHVEGEGFDQWTQARRLGEAEVMVRDLVAVMTGADPAAIEFTVQVHLPDAAREHVARAEALREEAARAQHEAAGEWRAAAAALSGEGLTVREIGEVLHVSHQRAQQLVKA
jgi:hypothetical protein